MSILVCGGAGYIGSHTCVELIQEGYEIIVADNFSNSSEEAIHRIEYITGTEVPFYKMNLCNKGEVDSIFNKHTDIQAVIHFAGLKAVGESVVKPLEYYTNNLFSTLNLLQIMKEHGVYKLVFSSSATVYGVPVSVPISESAPMGEPTNPYGASKLFQERILMDSCKADQNMGVVLLRYFNPTGAHESGLIGESPNGVPSNLLPYIGQVAIGHLERLNIYGNDYPTHDGTGVRDYIHVTDLAQGHIAALRKLNQTSGAHIYNLGTGIGYSVLDVLRVYEAVSGKEIPYVFAPRRPGDIAECFADPAKAKDELSWTAKHDLVEMCASSWKWQIKNPNGYGDSI